VQGERIKNYRHSGKFSFAPSAKENLSGIPFWLFFTETKNGIPDKIYKRYPR
jgi:hypothetical protein